MLHLKHGITLMLLMLIATIYGQNNYKSGYFIQNNGKRVNCLIQESDLSKTPVVFKYKISASSITYKIPTDSVKEVQITDGIRYKWVDINDETNNNTRLFLNVLVSGKASLYQHDYGKSVEYFFQMKDSTVQFLPPPDETNNQVNFITILKNNLVCTGLIDADFSTLTYSDRKLITLFIRYNVCKQDSYVKLEAKKEYDFFNLYIRPGLNYQSLSVQYLTTADFGHHPAWRFGTELEFVINATKNRTSIVLEPSYNYFKAEKSQGAEYLTVNYTYIEVPVGIRQYLLLFPKSELFANASYLMDVSFNSDIINRYYGVSQTTPLNDAIFTYSIGIGYTWNKRINFELHYSFQKELFPEEIYWQTDLSGFSFILGYNIFK